MNRSMQVSLARPCWELRDSYVECLRDFQRENPTRPVNWEWLEKFDLYLDYCRKEREPAQPGESRAPQTTFWIVLDGSKAVGKLNLRHSLTPKLEKLGGHMGYEIRSSYRGRGIASQAVALGLEEARAFGLSELIITCDDDNPASIRVLEKNGAVLMDRYALEEWPKLIRKYRISLSIGSEDGAFATL